MKPCWYKRDDKWQCGFFHQWSVNYEEFDAGPGPFAAAIVEDAITQECHVVFAGYVSFADDPPEGEAFVETDKVGKLLKEVIAAINRQASLV